MLGHGLRWSGRMRCQLILPFYSRTVRLCKPPWICLRYPCLPSSTEFFSKLFFDGADSVRDWSTAATHISDPRVLYPLLPSPRTTLADIVPCPGQPSSLSHYSTLPSPGPSVRCYRTVKIRHSKKKKGSFTTHYCLLCNKTA